MKKSKDDDPETRDQENEQFKITSKTKKTKHSSHTNDSRKQKKLETYIMLLERHQWMISKQYYKISLIANNSVTTKGIKMQNSYLGKTLDHWKEKKKT
jgi:hypothetical protein